MSITNSTPRSSSKSTAQPSPNPPSLIPVVVPGNISSRTDLSWTEKGVFALVYALSRKSGCCEASNEFLGQRLGLGSRYLPDVISKLTAKGLIHYLNPNPKSRQRRLGIAPGYDVLDPSPSFDTADAVCRDTADAVSSPVDHTGNPSDHTADAATSYSDRCMDHTADAVTSIKSEYEEEVNLSSDAQGAGEVKEVFASPSQEQEVGEEWLVKAEHLFRSNGVKDPRTVAVRRMALVLRQKEEANDVN